MCNIKQLSIALAGILLIINTSCSAPQREAAPQEFQPPPPFPAQGVAQREGGFELEDYWVWDPSVIKGDDGLYHMFASRWPKTINFHPGWMVKSEVIHATSETLAGPYTFQSVVFPARGAEYWDGRATHNPTIRKHGDTYILFYMGSTHPFPDVPTGEHISLADHRSILGRANKRIGIATAPSPWGPWTRYDRPILDTKPGTFYSFLTSNPAPLIREDGSVLMIFKSRAYAGTIDSPTHTPMMLGLARADHWRGPYYVVGDEPVFSRERLGEVEDPFFWESPTGGFEMVAKCMTGRLTLGEWGAGIHAFSPDGLNWTLAENPRAYSRYVHWDDGTTQMMGNLERVFLYLEEGRPRYLFGATADGPGGFTNATRTWIVAIPLGE
jgi:hypothetical protein